MESDYLPTVAANFSDDASRHRYGSDLRKYFIGNPNTIGRFVCGTKVICTAANSYLVE